MNLEDLVYRIAHDYPGGVRPLASRMSDRDGYAQLLLNKLNPNISTNHTSVREMEQIVDITDKNLEAAQFFAAKANAVVIPLMVCDGSDMALLDGFMEVVKELGEFSAEFQKDWADGRITAREFQRLKAKAFDVQARMFAHVNRIEQIVEQPKTQG